MERLTHDQMAFAVMKLYRELEHGRDFWVAHPVAVGSNEQIGDAQIVEWPKGQEPPDRTAILHAFKAHADEFHAQQAERLRFARLRDCDWTQLCDVPDATRNPWAKYRQALRDLPQQAGFPQSITWPEPPGSHTEEPKPEPEPPVSVPEVPQPPAG